jgi:hypothetical protein
MQIYYLIALFVGVILTGLLHFIFGGNTPTGGGGP